MDKTMTAAAWHREQARNQRLSDMKFPPASNPARRYAETAAYHDAAAEALEALAVPGVSEWVEAIAKARTFAVDDDEPMSNRPVDLVDDVRAALATLAKIGSER